MDFIAILLQIKDAIAKRLLGNSLDVADASKAGITRGLFTIGLTGVLFVGYIFVREWGEVDFGKMPQCDSPFTRELLTKVINESIAGQRGIRLLQVDEVADFSVRAPATSGEPHAEFRNCSAFVRTNAGRAILFFHLTWSSPKKDKVWLEITQSSL